MTNSAWTEADVTGSIPLEGTITQIQDQIQVILEKAKSINSRDQKLEALRGAIQERQHLPNNKIMLFSSFRHTLAYLYKHLKADGIRVGMIHGGVADEERLELRNRFEKPRTEHDSLDLMLFSEVGCEGLDYQFCDCMVNYDLPWNPMRIEQRIGRIDRNGQQSEHVTIFNLITPGTVDAEIYDRCLLRIGVFESALGGSEKILGEITQEIYSIAENFTLTDAERREKFQQLEDNQIRLVQEQERLEERELELFGLRLPKDQMQQDIDDATSFWLTPASIQRLVTLYLHQQLKTDQEFILGERHLKTLRLSGEARNIILRDFQQLPRERNLIYREWEKWLKGTDPLLSITFEADCRRDHPEVTLINIVHPLVKQAANMLNIKSDVVTKLKAQTQEVPAGCYKFAIYQWHFHGIKEDLELKSITLDEKLTPHLDRLLERAVDHENQGTSEPFAWDELDKRQYQLWAETLEKHRQNTRELAEYRRESLSTSHEAQINLLEYQRTQVDDPNIQRMRTYQIANTKADYNRRIQELEAAMTKADITTELVAYGILEVEGNA